MTDKQWKVTLDMVKKFHISQVVIADVLGLKKASICLKLNPNTPHKFSEIQKQKLHDYLLSMGKILVNSLENAD